MLEIDHFRLLTIYFPFSLDGKGSHDKLKQTVALRVFHHC